MNLVYAYGCRSPVAGWDHALAEHERCTILWDQLVELDRTIERELILRAQCDVPRLSEIAAEISVLTARLAEDDGDKAARLQRRELYREQRDLMKGWRKANRDVVKEYESRRQMAVKVARQRSDAWWPNSNRVLQSYETGRKVSRQFGRRLRLHDEERDDGVLAFQIQRTRSGLGADPSELFNGTVSALQIGAEHMEMRVDAEGNTLRLPITMHRPLPRNCRVKAAQLVWRRKAHKLVFRLCLTLSIPQEKLLEVGGVTPVEFTWTRTDHGMTVMRAGEREWSLPRSWCDRMDTLERMQTLLDESIAAGKAHWKDSREFGAAFADGGYLKLFDMLQGQWDRLPSDLRQWYRSTRQTWKSLCGLRSHLIGHRRDLYRLYARDVVSLHHTLQLPELDLAAIATADRGQEKNSERHRAAIHTLRAEIVHQATKARLPILDASAAVLNAAADEKSSAWQRRKTGKLQRSQIAAQVPDVSLGLT